MLKLLTVVNDHNYCNYWYIQWSELLVKPYQNMKKTDKLRSIWYKSYKENHIHSHFEAKTSPLIPSDPSVPMGQAWSSAPSGPGGPTATERSVAQELGSGLLRLGSAVGQLSVCYRYIMVYIIYMYIFNPVYISILYVYIYLYGSRP